MTFDRNAAMERIRKIVSEVLHVQPERVTESSRFTEDLGADSLDRLSLVMALEEAFGRAITDSEAERFTSVDAVLNFITSSAAAKAEVR